MRLLIITLQFQLKKQSEQTNKQTNNEINPLTLTVSFEKRSCFIKSKKKKTKSKQTNK